MNVLHVGTYDGFGGAARAAARLHAALLRDGVSSRFLVSAKEGDGVLVEQLSARFGSLRGKLRRRWDELPLRAYADRKPEPFNAARTDNAALLRRIAELDPDVVHLHWFQHAFLSVSDLAKIGKPVVWTLHDSWAFTGGCHCPQECVRWTGRCGNCPILNSGTERDLSRKIFERKAAVYPKLKRLRIVAPSEWLADAARRSALLGGVPVSAVPNALDTELFHPVDRNSARELLHLPKERKLVLFGAMNVLHDRNKGFDLLREALRLLPGDLGADLVLFGAPKEEALPELAVPVHNLGLFRDDAALCALYNACDAMVVPSRQENQPQTATEALACGTPVVAFRASGVRELVREGETGALAEPFDPSDLARCIRTVLGGDAERMRIRAREEAVRRFSYGVVAPMYERIYEEAVSGTTGTSLP